MLDAILEEIQALSQEISRWQASYYAGQPEVDDAHFDKALIVYWPWRQSTPNTLSRIARPPEWAQI
jgi:NAD-dependent DNA ligase